MTTTYDFDIIQFNEKWCFWLKRSFALEFAGNYAFSFLRLIFGEAFLSTLRRDVVIVPGVCRPLLLNCWRCIQCDLLVFDNNDHLYIYMYKKSFYLYIIKVTCDINMGTLLLLNPVFFHSPCGLLPYISTCPSLCRSRALNQLQTIIVCCLFVSTLHFLLYACT